MQAVGVTGDGIKGAGNKFTPGFLRAEKNGAYVVGLNGCVTSQWRKFHKQNVQGCD